jgi:hypothetical protein
MSLPPHRPSPEVRRDVEAALEARRELGPEYDDHIAAGLAERVDELVAMRIADTRIANQERLFDREDERSGRRQRFVLGIVSLGAGIPISGIAATQAEPGLLGLAVAWAGIVGVNVAAGWRNRAERR